MNILLFGPNGSGKGTQGALIKKAFGLAHIESGAIFREHIHNNTELGKQAQAYMKRGDLVPDDITIPMVRDTLLGVMDKGWLLDGFPRNMVQAQKLHEALEQKDVPIDFIIEIKLDNNIAKNRLMGRRLCKNDNNHPNNVAIPAIKPENNACRVCGEEIFTRPDDMDEAAITKRHDIYYDTNTGTLAAAYFFRDLCSQGQCTYITLDGTGDIKTIRDTLTKALGLTQ